eukprot:6196633-Amphidinium_carterae.2
MGEASGGASRLLLPTPYGGTSRFLRKSPRSDKLRGQLSLSVHTTSRLGRSRNRRLHDSCFLVRSRSSSTSPGSRFWCRQGSPTLLVSGLTFVTFAPSGFRFARLLG